MLIVHLYSLQQPFLSWAGSGECPLTLTIRTHLMRDRPKPEMAPYRPAADVVKQKDKKKPIQLKRNATLMTKTTFCIITRTAAVSYQAWPIDVGQFFKSRMFRSSVVKPAASHKVNSGTYNQCSTQAFDHSVQFKLAVYSKSLPAVKIKFTPISCVQSFPTDSGYWGLYKSKLWLKMKQKVR